MFCTACGIRIRDGDRFCRRCGHQVRGEHQKSLNPGDKSYISIMGDAEDPALDTREKLKQDKAKVLQTFNLIVDDPSIPVDDKVRAIINLTALTCAVVAIQPIPFADFFILTPIQVAMVIAMSRAMESPVGRHGAGEVLASVAGVVGWGLLAQQGILGLYKTVIPYAGALTTIPLVFALPWV